MNDAQWDTYPCRVDDAPATIRFTWRWEREPRPEACDTLHVVGFEMAEPGELGLGSEQEAHHLGSVEGALIEQLTPAGFVHVGRLRNRGSWQVAFYGPARHTALLLRHADDAAESATRTVWTHVTAEAGWAYYHTFLLPDAERQQWLSDRAVVEELARQGDQHANVRPVDHELVFPSREAAELFVETARMCGYTPTILDDISEREDRCSLGVRREDPVDLEHIHAAVMELTELAAPYAGDHAGWRTSVVTG